MRHANSDSTSSLTYWHPITMPGQPEVWVAYAFDGEREDYDTERFDSEEAAQRRADKLNDQESA